MGRIVGGRRVRARAGCAAAWATIGLAAAVGCSHKSESGTPQAVLRRPDRSVVLTDAGAAYVRIEKARPATSGRALSFAGRVTFDERKVARLGPAVGGRVAKVWVVTGDPVKKGDALLTIHAADVASAQAQVAQAKNAKALAERITERARTLQKEGAGTEAEVQQAETALAQARNEEQRAVAALAAIGGANGSSEYVLRSPADGTVIERNVAVGAAVSTAGEKPLITVGDLSTVWVVAEIFEQDLAPVKVGAEATIQVLALKRRTYTGTISKMTSIVDPLTRAAQARIELDNSDGALKPGMSARVFVRGSGAGAVEIPASALVARRDQFFVFVRQADGSFIEREVAVADQHGEHATVTNGLEPDNEIVTEGAILLDVEANEARR